MQVFAVIGIDSEGGVHRMAEQKFRLDHFVVDPTTILVAARNMTTENLSKELGIESGPDRGIVIAVGSYWGYHSTRIWEWLASKGQL